MIVIWLIWVLVMGAVFYQMENHTILEEAREELLDQADSVAGQLPVLAENHFCVKAGAAKSQNAKLKSLAMLLDENTDPETARGLLDEFTEITGSEELVVYDRQGTVLHRSGTSGAP